MNTYRKYLELKCELAVNPTDEKLKEMDTVIKFFINRQKPYKFNPYDTDNILMIHEKQFEDLCCSMEENGVANPKELTEFEFYSRLKYYEKKYKDNATKQI